MCPIDPATPVPSRDISPMAPPYADEDPNIASVEEGMEVAEDERRDAVTDAYEASARLSDDPAESLDDIDYRMEEDTTIAPELAAMDKGSDEDIEE